jgi:hypothetical protein
MTIDNTASHIYGPNSLFTRIITLTNIYIPSVPAFGSDDIVSVGRQRIIRNRKKPNNNA